MRLVCLKFCSGLTINDNRDINTVFGLLKRDLKCCWEYIFRYLALLRFKMTVSQQTFRDWSSINFDLDKSFTYIRIIYDF